MPPNQTPTVPPTPSPNMTPPAPMPLPTPSSGMPPLQPIPQMPMPPKQGSGKKILMIVVAVVVLLIVAGAAYALLKPDSKKSATTSNTSSASGQSSSSGSVKATDFSASSLSDYEKVCEGAGATNATAYGGVAPHPIVMMSPSIVTDHYIQSSVTFKNQTWLADYTKPESVQLVGCFNRKSEAASTKTCDLEDSNNNKVSLPLVPVVYELTIYEAKTGKKIGTKEVSGPATDCPYIATYDPSAPKLYGDPDSGEAETAVTQFVTK